MELSGFRAHSQRIHEAKHGLTLSPRAHQRKGLHSWSLMAINQYPSPSCQLREGRIQQGLCPSLPRSLQLHWGRGRLANTEYGTAEKQHSMPSWASSSGSQFPSPGNLPPTSALLPSAQPSHPARSRAMSSARAGPTTGTLSAASPAPHTTSVGVREWTKDPVLTTQALNVAGIHK